MCGICVSGQSNSVNGEGGHKEREGKVNRKEEGEENTWKIEEVKTGRTLK
jgi:hypothetical protein